MFVFPGCRAFKAASTWGAGHGELWVDAVGPRRPSASPVPAGRSFVPLPRPRSLPLGIRREQAGGQESAQRAYGSPHYILPTLNFLFCFVIKDRARAPDRTSLDDSRRPGSPEGPAAFRPEARPVAGGRRDGHVGCPGLTASLSVNHTGYGLYVFNENRRERQLRT